MSYFILSYRHSVGAGGRFSSWIRAPIEIDALRF